MFAPSTVVTSTGLFPSTTIHNAHRKTSECAMFSLELAPQELISMKPSNVFKSFQSQTMQVDLNHQSTSYHSSIVHGPSDRKRSKHNSGKAIIPSASSNSTTQTKVTNYETPVTIPIPITTHQTSHGTRVYNNNYNETVNTQSIKSVSNSGRLFSNIKCISKTPNNTYIIISVHESFPKDTSKRCGRKRKLHHKRNDRLTNLIDFIIKSKSIDMYDSSSSKWRDMHKNQKLSESQRDLLECLDGILHKFSNDDIAGLLTSYLNLQKNNHIRTEIQSQFQSQQRQQLQQILSNLSQCANSKSYHNKYEILMPVVPVLDYTEAKSNGFEVGYRCWTRASKLFKQTNDVTAKTSRRTKVCVYGCCFV